MYRVSRDFLSLFFPSICTLCKGPRAFGEPFICSFCMLKLPREINYLGSDNNTCQRIRGMFMFDLAYSYLRFFKGNSVQALLHQVKYQNSKGLALHLGIWFAAEVLLPVQDHFDLIVPVPIHPNKLKSRGYNQSYEIARGISRCTGRPVADILNRVRASGTQTGLSRWDRFQNTSEEFTLEKEQNLTNSRILLVDDVITTGATIAGTAIPLINSGAQISIVAAVGLTQFS